MAQHPPLSAQSVWQQAVAEVTEKVKATLPQDNGRFDNAVQLILNGHVELLPDGTAQVASQDDGTVYTVHFGPTGTCECPDFPQAPEGWCQHRIASAIAKKATELATQRLHALDAPAPTTASVSSRRPPQSAPAGRAGQPTPEQLVTDAVTQAERVCQAAIEATPPAYRGFLLFLPRNKKVGGTKSNPIYTAIREPYLGVDGRVKMAMDEHRAQGASLVMQTQFDVEPHSGQLLCRATVTSALLGSVTAHARVFVGGSGVDESNPLENAETSAVGRALGFLGYGIYGTGITSADEVLHAQTMRQGVTDNTLAPTPPTAGSLPTGGKPPTARQQGLLKELLREAGVPEEEIATRLTQVTTSREASARIDQLRSQLRQRGT